MNFSRRQFLLTGATLASGSMLQSFDFLNENAKLKTFGVQLYTLRDDLPKDPKGVLKQLAGFGYKQVESFEGPKGFFWGMTNKEFKAYLDSLGMSIVSSHCDFKKDFERKAAEAGEIGMKYLICPYLGPQKSLDGFKKAADDFNKAGEICKKNGIRFAYHNHNYSFNMQEGQLPQDVMMQNTDPTLVDFEMDIYWVVAAGADPITYLKKYPNRFKLCHVKDLIKTPTGHESCLLGKGTIDFKNILYVGAQNGLKFHIIEQESYTGTTELDCAKENAIALNILDWRA